MSEQHKMHVHYNEKNGHSGKLCQACLAAYDLKPGSQVSMHMHPGDCRRCPFGHCHEPNITLVMTEQGELMLVFEDFPPPLHVEANDRDEQPKVITKEIPTWIVSGDKH